MSRRISEDGAIGILPLIIDVNRTTKKSVNLQQKNNL